MKKNPENIYVAFDAAGEPIDFDTNWRELRDRVNGPGLPTTPARIDQFAHRGEVWRYSATLARKSHK